MSKRTRNPLMKMDNETWQDVANKYYNAYTEIEEDHGNIKDWTYSLIFGGILGAIAIFIHKLVIG